ncbi:MerR family transcriptional regulator [Paenibacillus glycanilyticus]|uniref:MerR family transcriptional regulator n=1 Tax=Paenibacillus glycanilyticus TaxID=126569 RepID=UPI00288B792F|nr:MerR family transcriptional regulator [Paenibacillus glycanilyticus]
MTLLKTKEAAQQLVVSETTVRRWVSTFPASFRKDMFGHYIFDASAMEKLRKIKGQLDSGTALYDIRLLSLAEEETLAAVAAEVMGTAGAVDQSQADRPAAKTDDSNKLVVDAAGNVHAAVAGAASEGTSGIGRGGGAGALVVDSAGNVHAAGASGAKVNNGAAGRAGALVVDSAGNVHAAGGTAVTGEAGSKASAEITAGLQHAAAATEVAGGVSARPVTPSPDSPAVKLQEASQATVPSAPIRPSSSIIDEPDPMLERLNAIEAALSQKADEVVTVQLLHHRKELEELRKSLTELAADIEALRSPLQQAADKAADSSESDGKRKKRGFRSFFFF